MFSHKTNQNQRICYVTIASCYLTKMVGQAWCTLYTTRHNLHSLFLLLKYCWQYLQGYFSMKVTLPRQVSLATLWSCCLQSCETMQNTLSMLHCSFSPGVPNLSLTMYPISISTDEHVPLKFLTTKTLRKIIKIQKFHIFE